MQLEIADKVKEVDDLCQAKRARRLLVFKMGN